MDIVRITHLDPSPSRTGGFGGSRRALTARLNDEWDHLVADPRVRADLAAAPIAGHHDLTTLSGGVRRRRRGPDGRRRRAARSGRRRRPGGPDARLAGRAPAGARRRSCASPSGAPVRPLAAAPRSSTSCARRRGSSSARYPLARRPRAIASNICRDTEYLTCVRPARLHDSRRCVPLRERDEPVVDLSGRPDLDASEELRWLLRDVGSAVALAEPELALLDALAGGASTATIASALGCTDRTVRNRRDRLVGRLRELAVDVAG